MHKQGASGQGGWRKNGALNSFYWCTSKMMEGKVEGSYRAVWAKSSYFGRLGLLDFPPDQSLSWKFGQTLREARRTSFGTARGAKETVVFRTMSRYPPRRVSLLVRNLPLDSRSDELRALFERFGEVRDVYLPRDYYTDRPRGFGFVEFRDPRDAEDALYHLDRSLFGGREISVVMSKESRKTPKEMVTREETTTGSGRRRRSRSPKYRSRSRSPHRRSTSHGRVRSRSPRRHREKRQERSGSQHRRSLTRSRSRSVSRSRSPARQNDKSRSRSPKQRVRNEQAPPNPAPGSASPNGKEYSRTP